MATVRPTDATPTWADGTSAAIVEPTSGKKSQGWLAQEKPPHQHFNWFWNLVSRWLTFFDDALFHEAGENGQHDEDGDHWEVVVRGADGVSKVIIHQTSGESSATKAIEIKNSSGTTLASFDFTGDLDATDLTAHTGRFFGASSGGAKVLVESEGGDVDGQGQMVVEDQTGTNAFVVTSLGRVVSRVVDIYGPGDFQPMSAADAVAIARGTDGGTVKEAVTDSTTYYLIGRALRCAPGHKLKEAHLAITRPSNAGQYARLHLYRKDWNVATGTAEDLDTATGNTYLAEAGTGTGIQTVADTTLNIAFTTTEATVYYPVVELDNNGSADEIELVGVKFVLKAA